MNDQKHPEATQPSNLKIPASIGPSDFDPDHPISSGDKEDRLGFRSVAELLASSLLTQTTSHGLVVSVEGEWGSGKSSLVNLMADALKNSQEKAPQIVRFEPWLVGDRDGMLVELMSDLALAVEAIEDQNEGNLKEETKKLAKQLRGYASKLSRKAASFAQLAEIIGVPGGGLVGNALEGIANVTDALDSTKSLPQVKEELTAGLHNLNQQIVVIIDDLDRLEPDEAAEIMRLIRAVADFPNVIYILCYDPQILADSLQQALSVKDGAAFLKKVIQVSFKVPQPEAFDLRRWFLDECLRFYAFVSEEQISDAVMQRLQQVCDGEGGLLKTPRDVVRATNAIKLYWPPISNKADYADLVWLQMVRLNNEDLYLWIERYLVDCSAIYEGASVSEAGKEELARELKVLLPDEGAQSPRSMWTFKAFVPGIRPGEIVAEKDRLFHLQNEANIAAFVRDRRLGSPHHSRYYFAFAIPSGALEDTELNKFILSALAGKNLEDLCTALILQVRPQGGSKFEVLIDRLYSLDEAALPADAVPPILMALANCMDEVGLKGGTGVWGVRWSWSAGKKLFGKLIARLAEDERSQVIEEIFTSGAAIGWLMSEIIRGEIFAHGRMGHEREPEENWIFSERELDDVIALLLDRSKTGDREKIIDTPDVLSLMYGWLQSGDEAGVMEWVREQHATDAGLLKLLAECRGWMHSDRTYHPLNRRDLAKFMNFDKALERLNEISENPNMTENERALAAELIRAAEIGKDN